MKKIDIIKAEKISYYIILLIALLYPLFYFPNIYGTDDFQILWMAQAIKNGVFFSKSTWIISFLSLLGFYPFSLRAIGIPLLLSLFLTIFEFFHLQMQYAILFFNYFELVILWISTKKFVEKVFLKNWKKFLFTTSILFSPYIIFNTTMMLSTRLSITIILINLINLFYSLLFLNQNSSEKKKPF